MLQLLHREGGLPSPAEVVLADDRKVGFLGEGDMSHQLLGSACPQMMCTDQGHVDSALPLQRQRHHGEVPVAEPLIDRLLQFVSRAFKGGEAVVAGGLQGEAHVLERERQSELGGEVALAIRCSVAPC